MSFSSMKDLLPQAMRQAGVVQRLDAAKVVYVAQSVAGQLFSPIQRPYIIPVAFVGKTLRVEITSPSAAHAIRLYARAWMEGINARLSQKIVTEIVVRRKGF